MKTRLSFTAWKQTMTGEQLDEMNEKFEDIEHEQFGEVGFEDAVKQISAIESGLGIAELSPFFNDAKNLFPQQPDGFPPR